MSYVAKVGLNYLTQAGQARRAEPGEVINDLPAKSLPWLLEQGLIEPAAEVKDGV